MSATRLGAAPPLFQAVAHAGVGKVADSGAQAFEIARAPADARWKWRRKPLKRLNPAMEMARSADGGHHMKQLPDRTD
jgi:hypothetical protein